MVHIFHPVVMLCDRTFLVLNFYLGMVYCDAPDPEEERLFLGMDTEIIISSAL